VPEPVPGPGTGQIVGIDRGVIVSAALSTGQLLRAPCLRTTQQQRLRRLQRRLARARRGSTRRTQARSAVARMKAREADARRDWVEKTSTDLARRFDLIRVEDLQIRNMTHSARGSITAPGRNVRAKAALNRAMLASGWGLLVRRLEQKAPGRVKKVHPAYTSQRCSACGHIAAGSRESQALFCCVACGYACNADVNAAKNIAAGQAVTARGGDGVTRPTNREPQLLLLLGVAAGIRRLRRGRMPRDSTLQRRADIPPGTTQVQDVADDLVAGPAGGGQDRLRVELHRPPARLLVLDRHHHAVWRGRGHREVAPD